MLPWRDAGYDYIRSGDTYKPDSAYKQKTVTATRTFTSMFFLDDSTADRGALFAALISPPERLGEVRRCAISRTPLPILQGGLLGDGEHRQLSLRLQPTHQQ
jgi:hypothetical protein